MNIFKLLTRTTAAKSEVALSYHRVRGLYILADVFAATIYHLNTASALLKVICCMISCIFHVICCLS